MIAEFKDIEKPFINGPGSYGSSHSSSDRHGDGGDRFRGMAMGAPYGRRGTGNAGGGERRRSSGRMAKEKRMENGDEDEDDYYLCDYSALTLAQRWAWLHFRNRALALSSRLTKVQTRRVARQTTDISV